MPICRRRAAGDAALRQEVESLLQFHDAAKEVDAAVFVPGEVFADRYRMVERIGRGRYGRCVARR